MSKVTAKQVMLDAIALKEKKSKDYQGGKWTEEDYFPFGDLSYMHMIHTKYLRMRNIMDTDVINFEGLEDTLIDMINYCAMYTAWIMNQKLIDKELVEDVNNNAYTPGDSEDEVWMQMEAMQKSIKEGNKEFDTRLWDIQKERT